MGIEGILIGVCGAAGLLVIAYLSGKTRPDNAPRVPPPLKPAPPPPVDAIVEAATATADEKRASDQQQIDAAKRGELSPAELARSKRGNR